MLNQKPPRGFLLLFAMTLILNCALPQNIPDSLQKKLTEAEPAERPAVLNQIAEHLCWDFPEEAVHYGEKALDEAKSKGITKENIKALLNIGDGYFYLDLNDSAQHYYNNALQLSLESDFSELIARSYYFLGYNDNLMHRLDRATLNYQQAIRIYNSIDMQQNVADLNYYLAMVQDKLGLQYEAKVNLEKALAIYDSLELNMDAAETLNALGVMFYNWGNYEKAIDYYEQSLEIMREAGNQSGVAQAFNNLGILYQDLKNPDEALKYYKASAELSMEAESKGVLAGTYNNIALIYTEKKQNETAFNYYEKALVLYEDMKDKEGIGTVLLNIGELHYEEERLELAILMLKKALNIQKEIDDLKGQAFTHSSLAKCYLEAGNIQLSKAYNDSSIVIAKKFDSPELLIAINKNYYRLNEEKGDYKKALAYFRTMASLEDTLYNKQVQKQLTDLKAGYDMTQKDQEIALLSTEAKANRLALENKQNIVERQRTILILVITGFFVILIVLGILFKQIKQKKTAFKALDEKNREIMQSREALVEAKERAEESDRLKSIFLANMSHELRTPLNGILGFTEVLRTELIDKEFREMADIIHTSGNRLLDTLNSIIDLSIIESNRMEIEHTKFSLEEFIGETITLFRASAIKKDIELSADLPDVDLLIKTDRKILSNLLNNLIDNAIKYTNAGSVAVTTGIENRSNTDWLIVRVNDTGIGIEAERLKHIFDKFRQGSEGHDRQFEGAGLGLTICKKYVEILDGKIIAKSQLEKGSEFRIEIPVETEKMAMESFSAAGPATARSNGFTGPAPNILIVENDEINLKHMVYVLKDWCTVDTAKNGREAVYKAGQVIFDAILMDINLGTGPNGMDTAKSIREINGYTDTPIIAVTANAMKGHREEFLANGCSHYLSKPFSADELKKLVAEAVEAV